jgi:hypothetical protein
MIGLLLSAIGFLGLTAVGCDSNDGEGADAGRVRICNSDDAAYGVEVIHRADYEVVDNFSVSAGSSVAWNCEESGEIEVGAYYLRLYKDNGTFFAKSPDFMVTDKGGDDMATVFITQSGEVGVIDADVGGRGDISVCNLDDESFIVELRADKDGGVVGVFTLHEAGGCDEFQNVETGVYYLQIIGQENRNNTDKSVTFLLEENEVERFEINTSSSILKTTD